MSLTGAGSNSYLGAAGRGPDKTQLQQPKNTKNVTPLLARYTLVLEKMVRKGLRVISMKLPNLTPIRGPRATGPRFEDAEVKRRVNSRNSAARWEQQLRSMPMLPP